MVAHHQLPRAPCRRRGEEVVLVAQALRERGQRRPEARVELGAQQGDEEPTHAIARVTQVGVRAIDREAVAALGEEAAHVGAGRGKQRAQEPAARRAHGAEAAPSRAAQQAQQQGLHLVVLGVAGDDAARADLTRQPGERLVARPPGPRLEVGAGRHRHRAPDEGDAQAGRQCRHPLGFGRPLRPTETVIDVGGRQAEAAPGRQLGERRQQRRRVGSSRDRDQEVLAGCRAAGRGQRRRQPADEHGRLGAGAHAPGLAPTSSGPARRRGPCGWRTPRAPCGRGCRASGRCCSGASSPSPR